MSLFSVITPTFNRSQELERCLNSLAQQTFKDFEVIVVDDGSSENISQLIEKWKNQLLIKYIRRSEPSGSPVAPRNQAAFESQSEWLCFLDSDDWWYPEKLSVISKYVKDCDFIYHPLHRYVENKQQGVMKTRQLSLPVFQDLMIYHNGIVTSGACIRKNIFQKVGGFYSFLFAEDYELWLRVSLETDKFKAVTSILGAYQEHSQGLSKRHDRAIQALNVILENYLAKLPTHLQPTAIAMSMYIQGRHFHAAQNWISAQQSYLGALKHVDIKIRTKALIALIAAYLKIII